MSHIRVKILVILMICIAFFSSFTETCEAKAKKTISVPSLKSCYIKNNTITVTWSGVKDADGYQILKKEKGKGKKYRKIATVKKNCRGYADKKISPGKKYIYTVRAFDKRKKKTYYSKYSKLGISVLDVPVITKIEDKGANKTIYWTNCAGVDGYRVYCKTKKRKEWTRIGKTVKTKYTIQNFRDSNYYTVRAYKQVGKRTIYSIYDKNFNGHNRRFKDIKIIFDGASTVYGSLQDGKRAAVPFAKRVSLLTGVVSENIACPGNTITNGKGCGSISSSIQKDPDRYKDYDIVCINVGTNDYKRARQLGEASDIWQCFDNLCSEECGDTELLEKINPQPDTFYGALSYVIYNIKEQNPSAKIILMTPQFCAKYGSKIGINAYQYKNARGYTLEDYSNAVKDVAAFYGVNAYDTERENIVNYGNYKTRTCDYVHATQQTYIKIGDSLTNYMIRNHIL